ncbi:MAG: hypothetical protein FWE97_02575, partial [Dehalococcoidia bacterium]|nr:hypothetical protein [Dehalococcoidia bacterium]
IAAAFITPSYPCLITPIDILANDASDKAIIVLETPFSTEGMATEITRNYGQEIQVPIANATIGGLTLPVSVSVKYLGANGWVDYNLPGSRRLVIGDVPGSDRNRTAVYKVTYSAGEGMQRSELVYTIWAGLEMFLTTADELISFVGDTFTLPECRPVYRHRDADSTIQYIDISATRRITFYPSGSADAVHYDIIGNTITFYEAGVYKLTFSSPQTIAEGGVTYVSGSAERVAFVNVYAERANPLSGKDGFYRCAYTIGGTSEIGIGMAQASCKSTIDIEKRDGNFYLYFTLTAAQYMDNLIIEQGGCAVAGLKVAESYAGVNLHATTIFVLDGHQLSEAFFVQIKIIPMDGIVAFTVNADLKNVYFTEETDAPPPSALPIVQVDDVHDSADYAIGTSIAIPSAEVVFDGTYALSYSAHYESANGNREIVNINDGQFIAEKIGLYAIKYSALIVEDGRPYATIVQHTLTVKAESGVFWKSAGGILSMIGIGLAVIGIATVAVMFFKRSEA